MLLRRVSISWLKAQTHGSQLRCYLLCGQAGHAHTGSVSTCSEQKTSLGATVVCPGGQAVIEKAALATSATLDLTKGWSASASMKYWET